MKMAYNNIVVTFIFYACFVEGKIKPVGTWNRLFRYSNLTVSDYIETLSWKTGNYTEENGLNYKASNCEFQVSETLLGVDLRGTVLFTSGIVTSDGFVVPTKMATTANRSEDLPTAELYFSVGVNQLDLSYNLETNFVSNNTVGTVEAILKNIHFYFLLVHTFSTNTNTITPESITFGTMAEWKISPRNLVTYSIETILKRNEDSNSWYMKDLESWQSEILAPLLVEQAKDIPFPISPY